MTKIEEIRIKQSIARKNWLKRTDPEILNQIYKKMAETKKLKYKLGLTLPWNKGKKRPPFSNKWRANLSKSLIGHKSSDNVSKKLILRNKNNNPMWNQDIVRKAVLKRNYKEISQKTTLTKRMNGTFLEYSKRMKENNPMKNPIINAKVNKNPEYMKKRISALIRKPNKKEKIIIDLIDKNNLPYEYVGDGKLIIGSKNPDFIHRGKNKIIELFGEYWHKNRARVYEETEMGRIEYFKKYNFDTLVIWEKELKNLSFVNIRLSLKSLNI